MNGEIKKLGEHMLSDDSDIANVYEAIRRYFPVDYLSDKDVAMVKTYNFDGPVACSRKIEIPGLQPVAAGATMERR